MTADIRWTQYARARDGAGKIPREIEEAVAALLPAAACGGHAIIVC